MTKKLQRAITASSEDGEIIGVRSGPYRVNFLDGKKYANGNDYIAKPEGVDAFITYKNGVGELEDGTKYISDLDIGFLTKNGMVRSEKYSLELGEKINTSYGHVVVTHGDNVWGVKKGVQKAIDVQEDSQEILYIFNNKGFVEAGSYKDIIDRYVKNMR
ncbi:MAG: hypothetical protein ABII64_00545 [Elusimicrobiota bacterium]